MKAIKTLLLTAIALTAIACFNIKVSASELALTIRAGDSVYYYSGEEIAFYKGKYYLKGCLGAVDGIYYDTLTPSVNASATFVGGKSPTFNFSSEKLGRGIDKPDLLTKIDNALNNGVKEISAKFIDIQPEITLAELKKQTFLRATFKTDYSLSSHERKHNIELACKKINGKVLGVGEVFSFNEVVGERSEDNGFKNAVVILNGEYTTGVGGGVCQVSTTLYNCALLSGLKTSERHPHSLLPSYVKPSLDAMVSGSSCDLKFVNTTQGKVYISAYANGNTVTFSIYGLKPEFEYKLSSTVLEKTEPPPPQITINESLGANEVVILKTAKPKIKSKAELITLKNGKQVGVLTLHFDEYKSVQGKIEMGKPMINEQTSLFYLTKVVYHYKISV